ncbi:MAG: low specificity L-threonine aldolase [Sphingomonadaceae bacterium]|nr:low specificity L-threonine aldolase [Sphingomonadaceae bacterium]
MNFQSDNAAGVRLDILAAVTAAVGPSAHAYDGDAWTARLDDAYSDLFGYRCTVLPVSTGTAANALALAAMVPPYGAVVCHAEAHINVDECGAPEFFSGGAKLVLCAGEAGKLTPATVAAATAGFRGDIHQVQPRALSLTQATECGTVYAPAEVAALAGLARDRGWRVHMDGARFANAVAALGCHPGDVTWRAGVDVLSLGVIKNGGMSAEAMVIFAPDLVEQVRFRRKRAGQLPSKGRFAAAQLLAYIDGGRWLATAAVANAGAQRLAKAAGSRVVWPVEANEVFVRLDAAEAARLRGAGFLFYDWGLPAEGIVRLVVAWDTPPGDIDALAAALG